MGLEVEAMQHERIRMFNIQEMFPGQALENDLSQAVVADDTVYLSGQVSVDADGNFVAGDAAAQAEQAMQNVAVLLREARCDLSDIVKITIYLTDRTDRVSVYKVIGHWLKGIFPACTGLYVAGLASPDWLMEIDVVAARQSP
jgi:enamine deaminase RidA (YjgF/YER057c/UK114 family)